jgi:hypothetical protein
VEKSYGSRNYFAFSKAASCVSIELPQGFRNIQKTYGVNNAFLPLLDDYIGAAYSNGHSASKASSNPVACYHVALM